MTTEATDWIPEGEVWVLKPTPGKWWKLSLRDLALRCTRLSDGSPVEVPDWAPFRGQ